MKNWKLSIKYNGFKATEIELIDIKNFFEGYLKLKRSYFTSLTKAVKISKKYSVIKGIEKVFSPNQEDWTINPWVLLLIKDDEKENPFWLLFLREKDLSGELVAIGPQEFVTYIMNDVEGKKELKRLLNYIITYLNKFECIIMIPNFLL